MTTLSKIVACGPDWKRSWPTSAADEVAVFLQSRISWPDDAEAFFVWMREQTARVLWGVSPRTWQAFLFSDEGPFLVRLQLPEFVLFPPLGPVMVGSRAAPGAAPDCGST